MTPKLTASSASKFKSKTAGVANRADEWRIFKSISFGRAADWAMTLPGIFWLIVQNITEKPTMRLRAMPSAKSLAVWLAASVPLADVGGALGEISTP
jgi:hypothetical protein